MSDSEFHRAAQAAGHKRLTAAACYLAGAAIGTWLGRQFYQPNPAAIGQHLVFSDLRYAGALAGAMVGALLAALLPGLWPNLRAKPLLILIMLVAGGFLGYTLFEANTWLGLGTTCLVALPWVIAVTK